LFAFVSAEWLQLKNSWSSSCDIWYGDVEYQVHIEANITPGKEFESIASMQPIRDDTLPFTTKDKTHVVPITILGIDLTNRQVYPFIVMFVPL
uniref:Neur_chan_LBD domain-containing protein n=1 Tax=Ascaris lumbricoides TaxID=6252 RepID=A0A0M3HQL3_ASCLU